MHEVCKKGSVASLWRSGTAGRIFQTFDEQFVAVDDAPPPHPHPHLSVVYTIKIKKIKKIKRIPNAPLPICHKLLGFRLGHIHFSDTYTPKTLGLTICTIYSAILCQWAVNWLRELSRFTVRARGKSMVSWHCTVEFHSPCTSSLGQTYSAHIGV